MTDPIASMLIMIKNASLAGRDSITVPYSKIKESIATCLIKNGYVKDIIKKTKDGHPALQLDLMYTDGEAKVSNVKRISKPSRRVYMSAKDIHKVKSGYGLLVLSTPKGIMAGGDARKEMVGGEVLFSIW